MNTERKYFLDWLRVIAFGLLILFHVGMLYVTWNYNIKSPRIYAHVEWLMIALSPWRLALLFFISGVACRFLMTKLSPGAFTKDRIKRLVPVIFFGILVVNPPQTYIELFSKGVVDSGYFEFWFGTYLVADQSLGIAIPRWDHLWFLIYLLLYILVLAAIYRARNNWFSSEVTYTIPIWFLVLGPVFWLTMSNILISEFNPITNAVFDDWAAHIKWAGMFGFGVVAAMRIEFWEWLRANRRMLAVATGVLLGLVWLNRAVWLAGNWDPFWDGIIYSILTGFYGWAMILTLSGFAAQHLNHQSSTLSYLTVAVLPIYVLHQPILLIAAYLLFPLALPPIVEATALMATTGLCAVAIYEILIRRINHSRFLFGLKPKITQEAPA